MAAVLAELQKLPPVGNIEEEGVIEEWETMTSELSFEISGGWTALWK